MIQTTKSVLENTINQALELAKSANSAFRTHDDVAVALPGGLFGHVRHGRLVGFGLEPVGDVYVDEERHVTDLPDGGPGHLLWGRIAAVAGGATAAASAVAGVVTAVVLGRRNTAG
ncbi:MAG: hypothetical protein JST64_07705 [Actinobacteria bacterium]|nr:hypothetical protein [Actinomycetota bacterium]